MSGTEGGSSDIGGDVLVWRLVDVRWSQLGFLLRWQHRCASIGVTGTGRALDIRLFSSRIKTRPCAGRMGLFFSST